MIKKMICLIALIGITFGFGHLVSASEETHTDSIDEFYRSPDSIEPIFTVKATEDNSVVSNRLSRSAKQIKADVWMFVGTTWGGKPALSKYWHMKYYKGQKYAGWVYFTGQKRIKEYAPVVFEFRFKGTLTKS